jgi:cytochrome c-type biogenesis protein CcmH/NrfG
MMKTWFWIVLAAFLVLAAYVLLDSMQRSRREAGSTVVPFEVSAESVAVYEQRVTELQARADSLKE